MRAISPAPQLRPRPRPARWDLVVESFDEGDFLWRMRERLMRSARHSIQDVERIAEQRLLGCADGVWLGAERALRELLLPSDCSPEFDPDEPHGIKLAVPASFKLSSRADDGSAAPLPICFTVRLDGPTFVRFEHVFKAVKVVLIDDEHREVLSGGVWRDRHYLPTPPGPLTPDALAQRTFTTYSTVNLREFIAIPERDATYKVQALLEQYRSNQATLRIEVE